ncbi:MAG TPA: DUF4382 domain-containing protein [Noviherbaspirillum sp.]|nr:DUF4382 domain-containing protein [Noviherbaspirillum sp.]
MIKLVRHAGLLAAIGLTIPLSGCGGGSNDAIAEGTLRVLLTNTGSSACGYDVVNISVDAVTINKNPDAMPGDAGWQPTDVPLALRQSKKVDLMALINSSPSELVTMTVPAAHYAQIRMWLEQDSVLVVKPNWVTPSGASADTEVALDTSNAATFRIPYAFTVPANGQVDLTLDFDACRSVINSDGKPKLVPAISATAAGA